MTIIACNYVSEKRQVGFQLWSANLVFFFIKDHQAQTFGFACLKQKFIIIKVHTAFITLPKYIG